MFVKPPIHARYTVREYVVLVRLIPLQYVALLLAEFPQISGHEMGVDLSKWNLLLVQPPFE